MSDLSGRTTVIVGASRGLGRGIAGAFAEAGAAVVAVARTGPALAELATTSPTIRTEVADAADATVPSTLLGRHEAEVLVLVAGAVPVMRPLQDQTWETFSVNWDTDVKIAFTWLRAALLQPLPPGSRVVVVSSGAAINGSPASGGYAGAKATQRFLAAYAALGTVTRVPSDHPGTRRYQEVISIESGRRYQGAVHYLFPGGCVTYRLDFRSDEQARPLGEVLLALGFVPRDALRQTLDDFTGGDLPLDPPAAGS
jgi:NAD(P)-dependent dehydrogenase (short-subunit alcohol dehydrogenase family)